MKARERPTQSKQAYLGRSEVFPSQELAPVGMSVEESNRHHPHSVTMALVLDPGCGRTDMSSGYPVRARRLRCVNVCSLHRDRFCQAAWLVDVFTHHDGGMIGDELHRNGIDQWRHPLVHGRQRKLQQRVHMHFERTSEIAQ
jgi:hypothetical protein